MVIKEDYVSFETAKLLKEKGFYQDFYNSFVPVWHYNGNNKVLSFTEDDSYPSETQEWYSAPTLQMAMKWLRMNGWVISIIPLAFYCGEIVSDWGYYIWADDNLEIDEDSTPKFTTYEEACEAAIKYCLENLI